MARTTYIKTGHVASLTFDNPSSHNAMTWGMWSDLAEICGRIAQDAEVRVVTMRGAGGKAFVSGTDISGFRGFTSGADGLEYERRIDAYLGAVEALPQPTIAVVDGWAVGGGLALAFAADFRIATPAARFGSPLARTIGNCLSIKSYARLVAHIGVTQAKRMIMLGEMISAEELFAGGHLHAVVPAEDVDATVADLCDRLPSMAPLTLTATKEAIRRLTYANLPDISDLVERVYGSEDFHTGVANFLEKKKTTWSGR